ncbi:ATP-binding protein [Acidisoma silvae]|uniref:ATP-grasp domain-containing protein n=1 Tax=Acidisoma silvae TaxID=2802396 RepID=A0A963YTW8_9PROT|nr:ATP-grasp domain-containing protein [Acidisoma silvae]MCB8876462.1 ATP-grasp domain-containing protein [Acidisoma silvae]
MGSATRRTGRARILFVALTNDVGSDRLPAALGALGADCAVLCPPGFYCAETRFMGRRFPLPAQRGLWLALPFIRNRLEAATRDWDADLVIPLDDMAALSLRVIATAATVTAPLRALLEISLGSPRGYTTACTRAGLMRLASELGLRTPRVCISAEPDAMLQRAQDWGYPVVLKAEHTCGGHGVTIARNPDELRRAMAAVRGATSWRRLRGALRRKMWDVAGFSTAIDAPPVLQSYVAGVPAMRTVFAWQGEVLEGVSFLAEKNHPTPTGPSTMVRHVENAEMAETSRQLVAAMGCSGFISFDFMFDPATRQASLIELNARPIGTTHLGRLFGHDLCARLLSCLDSGFRPVPWRPAPILASPLVALFPKEIERSPRDLGRLEARCLYHDVPYDEPRVMAAYLRRLQAIHPQDFGPIFDAYGAATGRRPALDAPALDWLRGPSQPYAEGRRHA